jgi:citrate synthase
MMIEVPSEPLELNPVVAKAMDLLFILHADHEQNASTSTVRLVGSTGANPYASVAAGIAALWGPAHGGANEAVLKMLAEIGTPGEREVRDRQGQGQGIRFPPDGLRPPRVQELRPARGDHARDDPRGAGRARRQRPAAGSGDAAGGSALQDEYFVQRKLYPNVDFYSGIIYKALGIPTEMFTVMFAIARTAGWVSHWLEQQNDPENRIGRPRQIYTGAPTRDYVGMGQR